MSKGSALILAFLTGIALIAAAWVLSSGFNQIAKPDRTVTVRGLAEREVDADLAVWRLSFDLGGNSLQELQKDILDKSNIIIDYLKKYGLTEADYNQEAPSITDTSLQTFNSEKAQYKYIANSYILIRSNNIKAVKQAHDNVIELMSKDIVISQDYDSRVEFEYTSLNTIKPEMIGEATKNARSAAKQFADDSGSNVGKIKSATQGLFSIESAANGLNERKKIRVVTTIEYTLID